MKYILLFCLLISSIAPSSAQFIKSTKSVAFEEIKFDVPSEWVVKTGDDHLFVHTPVENDGDLFLENIQVSIVSDNSIALETINESQVAGLLKDYSLNDLAFEKQSTNSAGLTMKVYTANYDVETLSLTMKVVYVEKLSKLYQIVFMREVYSRPYYKNKFKHIPGTIR